MNVKKVILLTGATDGIGLETARRLMSQQQHHLLLHGRSESKLQNVVKELGSDNVETYCCDLSKLSTIQDFTQSIKSKHPHIDVIINNAGVFRMSNARTDEGLDARFAVNTIAPYMITKSLADSSSRVINLSSAAQAPVNLDALAGTRAIFDDGQAYAQSKLALTQWTNHMAAQPDGPIAVSVNPASFLGSKMVKEAYGMDGHDLGIGADILVRAATTEEFGRSANGKYYDNDNRRFASPHPDANNQQKNQAIVDVIESVMGRLDEYCTSSK